MERLYSALSIPPFEIMFNLQPACYLCMSGISLDSSPVAVSLPTLTSPPLPLQVRAPQTVCLLRGKDPTLHRVSLEPLLPSSPRSSLDPLRNVSHSIGPGAENVLAQKGPQKTWSVLSSTPGCLPMDASFPPSQQTLPCN